MKNDVSLAWHYANEILVEIQNWIKATDKKPARLTLKPKDMLRLLRFRTWSLRYYTSVEEILTLVLPILRRNIPGQKERYGIGVTISCLTGFAAEKILRQKLAERYPGKEHVVVWRAQERQRQLDRERKDELGDMAVKQTQAMVLVQFPSIDEFVGRYRDRIKKRRTIFEKEVTASWRRRKPYRWNPWQ